ncbi:Calcium-dependent protein kinase 2 [Durusdinium trenchii]|uniref:Calcium-dependent protein kinase 2 n=1 Tax=Durusdinium trenchii TaxID=1381693 RepID=A0ABP0NTD6_9DINO
MKLLYLSGTLYQAYGATLPFAHDDSARCVHFQRPGHILMYSQDTVIFPIGISVPSDVVASSVPKKIRVDAGFVGSSKGGQVSEYKFGPMEEARYHDFYRRHRFALTKCKGGWDAFRHPEILAMGTVPRFAGLAKAPPFTVPFIPKSLLLQAEEELRPYSKHLEAVYNATVLQLLDHTRRCLTAESMAARVLRTMGLWPTKRPLKLLYVTCGFGYTGAGDGWQGPVSIGLFLGLQALLREVPGSRIVDGPAMDPNPAIWPEETEHRSNFWYLARNHDPWIHEEDLRQRMYGYGFSYARRLSVKDLASQAEREDVPKALQRREFDGIIYGKVGPAQGCEPLPFYDDVQAAGYPGEVRGRVAFVYGGDFGLAEAQRLPEQTSGVTESNTEKTKSARRVVTSCKFQFPVNDGEQGYCDPFWKQFFKLWRVRLKCWNCDEADAPLRTQYWDEHFQQVWAGYPWSKGAEQTGWGTSQMIIVLRVLNEEAEEHVTFKPRRCVLPQLRRGARAFRRTFQVAPQEIQHFVRSACEGLRGSSSRGRLDAFDAAFVGDGRSLLELRMEKASELRVAQWHVYRKEQIVMSVELQFAGEMGSFEVWPGAQLLSVELPAPLWVGADVIKALAAPTLAKLVYQPPSQEELGRDPVLVAEERSTHAVEPSKPPKDEAIRAHEYRAAVFLRKGQPVATLAELEAALCLSEKRSLIPPNEIRERWQTLAASALAWSFDCLAQAAQPGNQWQTQVLQMLCTCEILTRFEVAETFGAESMVLRPFLRALSHLGLGQYYQLRKKPRAAARFLEQAANGQAQWVHPAILLNLSSVHLLLKEPGKALSCLCQVVLALKNSIGPLCPNSDQVEGALEAAQTAVTQVLGPIKEDQRQAALVEVDPFGHGIDLGEEKGRSLRVVPGHLLDTPEVSKSTVVQEAKVPSTPRRGLGRHGLISKEHLQGEEAFGYEVDAAVVRILLRAKALLKPEAQAETEAEAGKKALEETLRKMAAPGVAKHYAKLKQVWPYWKSVTQDLGIGLVFRECLLLCFLHVACALAQLSSKRVYDLWVVPSLREGLVLAIVLFGSKHPLALKLMNASRRLQPEVQHSDPPPKVQRPSMARRTRSAKPREDSAGLERRAWDAARRDEWEVLKG